MLSKILLACCMVVWQDQWKISIDWNYTVYVLWCSTHRHTPSRVRNCPFLSVPMLLVSMATWCSPSIKLLRAGPYLMATSHVVTHFFIVSICCKLLCWCFNWCSFECSVVLINITNYLAANTVKHGSRNAESNKRLWYDFSKPFLIYLEEIQIEEISGLHLGLGWHWCRKVHV